MTFNSVLLPRFAAGQQCAGYVYVSSDRPACRRQVLRAAVAPLFPTCSPLSPVPPLSATTPSVRSNISLFGTAAPPEGLAPDEEEDDQPGVMDGLKSLLPISVQDADPPATGGVSPWHSQFRCHQTTERGPRSLSHLSVQPHLTVRVTAL